MWKNWEKSDSIENITREKDSLILVYGTNSLVKSLPLHEILTFEEAAYSERLRGEEQKSTWLSCRATLRLILGSYLGKKPIDIEFRKGRYGKLYLPGTNLFFNVSHSKSAFLLGFSFWGRIGVDIELLNGSEDLPSMVEYAFSNAEVQYCHNGENRARFTEIWTLKEAFLKAVGIGLVDQLTSISVSEIVQNDISRIKLNHKSFFCPNGETGSIVYTKNKPVKFIWLT